MPYTDDPSNEPVDAVRLLVGDTSTTSPDLTDSAIEYFLAEEGDNVQRAAARAAEALSAKYAKMAEEKRVGPLWIRSFSDKSTKLANLAKLLWRRANSSSAVPFAGGISRSDKLSRVLDGDRVRPVFRRRMMTYRNGSNATGPVTSEEIISEDRL